MISITLLVGEGGRGYSLRDRRRTRAFWEGHVVSQDVRKRCVSVLAFEGGGPVEHFVDQDAECPPVYCAGVAATFDDLRRDVFLRAHKGICSEVVDA